MNHDIGDLLKSWSFDPDEVNARLQARIAEMQSRHQAECVEIGDVTFNRIQRFVEKDGKRQEERREE